MYKKDLIDIVKVMWAVVRIIIELKMYGLI
jgi:hypothetical protein